MSSKKAPSKSRASKPQSTALTVAAIAPPVTGVVVDTVEILTRKYKSLATEYLANEDARAELYRKLGRILNDIKAQLAHGQWEAWAKEHLPKLQLTSTQAKLRMNVGNLPDPPISTGNRRFTLVEWAAIGRIAGADRHLSTADAVQRFDERQPKAEVKGKPSRRGTVAVKDAKTWAEVFEQLAIDINAPVTRDSLATLERQLEQLRKNGKTRSRTRNGVQRLGGAQQTRLGPAM